MGDMVEELIRLRAQLEACLTAVDAQLAATRARSADAGQPQTPDLAGGGWWLEYRRSPAGWWPATVHRSTCFVRPAGRRDPLTDREARLLLAEESVTDCPGCRDEPQSDQ